MAHSTKCTVGTLISALGVLLILLTWMSISSQLHDLERQSFTAITVHKRSIQPNRNKLFDSIIQVRAYPDFRRNVSHNRGSRADGFR